MQDLCTSGPGSLLKCQVALISLIRYPNAKIIMCSALGQEALVMEALDAGASDFIVKPFQPDDVLKVVNKVLNR